MLPLQANQIVAAILVVMFTTLAEADAGGARDLDAASAALILEQYLRSESE